MLCVHHPNVWIGCPAPCNPSLPVLSQNRDTDRPTQRREAATRVLLTSNNFMVRGEAVGGDEWRHTPATAAEEDDEDGATAMHIQTHTYTPISVPVVETLSADIRGEQA